MFDRPYENFSIGDTYFSVPRTVVAGDLDTFADWSGDHYPLHTDSEYAQTTKYGQRILHGLGVLSLAFGLVPLKAPEVLALYGINHARFFRPVKIGDTVHARLTCTALADMVHGGMVTVHMVAEDDELNGFMAADLMILMRHAL